jgi:hypothetical protein
MPTRVQTAFAGGDGGQGTTLAAVFGSNVTAGALLVVVLRDTNLNAVTVADTLGTSYSVAVISEAQDPNLAIFYGIALSSGANTVTATWPARGTNYGWEYAVEVRGQWERLMVVANSKTGTGVTDLVSDPINTPFATGYLLLGVSQGAFTSYTAGVDFTLVDGTIPTNPNDFGGVEERILSGMLTSYTAHITSGSITAYTMVLAAFLEAIPGCVGPRRRGRHPAVSSPGGYF